MHGAYYKVVIMRIKHFFHVFGIKLRLPRLNAGGNVYLVTVKSADARKLFKIFFRVVFAYAVFVLLERVEMVRYCYMRDARRYRFFYNFLHRRMRVERNFAVNMIICQKHTEPFPS